MGAEQSDNQLLDFSDAQLWQAYVEGRDDAFQEVRRRYQEPLFRYLLLSLTDLRGAAEQLASVLSLAAAYRRPMEGFDSLKGWLFAVATQTAAPAHARDEGGLLEFMAELKRGEPTNKQENILHAVHDLRREIRQPFLLVAAVGLSIAEAAKACRFTPERTRRCVGRAYRELASSGILAEE